MSKLLFVGGNVYHPHLYNFSRELSKLGFEIYAINLSTGLGKDKQTADGPYKKIWWKPSYPKVRIVDFFVKLLGVIYLMLSIKEEIDLVQFHFLDKYHTLPMVILAKIKGYKVSSFVYGSDFYRSSKWGKIYLKYVFKLSDSVVCDSLVLKRKLVDTYPKEKCKIESLLFGSIIIDELYEKYRDVEKTADRYNVMCGYNGYRAQNHLQIASSLLEFKDIIHLIIPMTYGCDGVYIDEVKKYLYDHNFDFEIHNSFIQDKEWEDILFRTDIFIHMQDSDAFSSTLAEHLLLGNIVINAEWLLYEELKSKDIYIHSANFNNLQSRFRKIVENYLNEKIKYRSNCDKIYTMKSLKYCCKEYWEPYYEGLIDQ